MDPTGFAIGVLSLTQIVSTCIDTFKIIQSIRSYGHDASITMLKLGIERDLFIQWAYNAGLLQKHYVKANLFNPDRDKLIHDVLVKIRELLGEAEALARKYGMMPEGKEGEGGWRSGFDCGGEMDEGGRGWCVCERHARRHRHHHRGSREEEEGKLLAKQKKVSLPRKFMWTIHAKDEFEKLIEQLHFFIERLDQMVKSVDQRRTLMRDLKRSGADFSKLDLLEGGGRKERTRRKGRDYEGVGEDDWSDVMSVFGDDRESGREGGSRRHRSRKQVVRGGRERSSHRSSESDVSKDSVKSGRSRRSYDDDNDYGSPRSSGSYERPPAYHTLYSSGRSSGSSSHRSSRSTFGDMIGDIVGASSRGRSDFY